MTLRKERLEEIAELARKATYKPCAMHMTNLLAVCGSEVIEEMARKLLSGMAQEPYGYVHKEVYESEGSCGLSSDHEAHRDSRTHIPLYAAPQLPQPAMVVPDEMTPKQASRSYCGEVRGYRDGWNACRAAMLHGGNHAEQHLDMANSPVTPDGWQLVPKVVTPEIGNAINEVGQRCTCGNCSQRLWDLLIAAAQQQ